MLQEEDVFTSWMPMCSGLGGLNCFCQQSILYFSCAPWLLDRWYVFIVLHDSFSLTPELDPLFCRILNTCTDCTLSTVDQKIKHWCCWVLEMCTCVVYWSRVSKRLFGIPQIFFLWQFGEFSCVFYGHSPGGKFGSADWTWIVGLTAIAASYAHLTLVTLPTYSIVVHMGDIHWHKDLIPHQVQEKILKLAGKVSCSTKLDFLSMCKGFSILHQPHRQGF